jgi:NADPH-dependent 2,4-dienoyl-CoA reductase/sulfur reductase-like enzyme/nitrite reductase/ring-hydroxylating ferredoxin subunit
VTQQQSAAPGPDLTRGFPVASLSDGAIVLGHVGDEAVLLIRKGDAFFATGTACTHYGGPLAEGLIADGAIRCPWHHARFSLATGQALCAPALNPIASWEVVRHDDSVFVGQKRELVDGATKPRGQQSTHDAPDSIVIVGAGAAGNAAAEMLRRSGYEGPLTMIGAEADGPYDRPNLSKNYLAGDAPEEWIPLRPRDFYAQHAIALLSDVRVTAIDPVARRVLINGGGQRPFDRLLIATGASPVQLNVAGAMREHVHYLRSLADSRAIVAAAQHAQRVVVVGASFIGLEVAASLRKRGLDVHVVGSGRRPLERVFGPELGDMIRSLHEAHGVVFHLGDAVTAIGEKTVALATGGELLADLVVIGIGVRPRISLAEGAGLTLDRGIVVNEYLETSVQGVFAAGDIARWPDPHTGSNLRVEHWVVAERQGQVAARNMLADRDSALRERFDAVPFFWSQHYDVAVHYIGHAERWDDIAIDGALASHDATISYQLAGRTLAVATVGRDRAGLEAEVFIERHARAAINSRSEGARHAEAEARVRTGS